MTPKDKPKNSPRIEPQQERGRKTVQALLKATSELLEESGFDSLTTIIIAERAGVNVATLYRYFPNKFAVVRELAESFENERSETSITELSRLSTSDDWRQVIGDAITAVARLRVTRPGARAIRRALQSSKELWDLDHEVQASTARAITPFLTQANKDLLPDEAAAIALVVVNTVTTMLDLINDTNDSASGAVNGGELEKQLYLVIERYLEPHFAR